MTSNINIFNNLDNLKENTPSLNHGNKFMMSKKIKNKKIKHTNENYNNSNSNNIKESFENQSDNNLTTKSYDLLNKSYINTTESNNLDNLKNSYNIMLNKYESLLSNFENTSKQFIERISKSNQYLNKIVLFNSGELAYVTNKGILKLIPQNIKQHISGKNGCPKIDNPIKLNIPWKTEYNVPNTIIPTSPNLITGTPMNESQSCGNEGQNVYVDKLVTNPSETYMGCYVNNQTSQSLTFIGSKPQNIINIVNSDFSQPIIQNNSYKYINSYSAVPGWYFNAVLVNNSDAWGFKMPYPYGSQCVVIQGNQTISQGLNLSSGTYTLTFNAIGRNCCDNSGKGNTINVQINYATTFNVIYTFTPSTNNWQNYSVNFTIETSISNALTFQGTWTQSDRSTAIQNIRVSSNSTTNGNYTYDMCKQAAIDNGYNYFALQSINTSTQKGFCAVTNDSVSATKNGTSYIVTSTTPLWSSNTVGNNGSTASLQNSGSLSVINSNGTSIFSTPADTNNKANYVGCYRDQPNRAMNTWVQPNNWFTYNECLQQAQAQNQKYFGLQYSIVPNKGQCFLSNDINSTIKYGVANNCSNQNGTFFGGGWSNAVYSLQPSVNYYLILQDDGNMCIYRGSNPNDNQGLIWSSSTNGKQQKPDQSHTASKGKYGKNWITVGNTLAAGDFIGSNDGSIYLIMQTDGNLVLYTSNNGINCKKLNNNAMGGGINANALYKLNQVGNPSEMGKIAYIDDDSNLHSYQQNQLSLSNDYIKFENTDNNGNDIPSAAFSNANLSSCKMSCNNNKSCYGIVYDNETKTCYPKNQNIYPNTSKQLSNNKDLYIRKKNIIQYPNGIDRQINNIDSIQFKNYKTTDKNINYTLNGITEKQRTQLDNLKNKLDNLSSKILNIGSKIHQNDLNVTQQSIQNTNSLSKMLNDTNNINQQIVNYDTSVDNILNDSDIMLLYENYNYLFWSIIAAGTLLISLNISKSHNNP